MASLRRRHQHRAAGLCEPRRRSRNGPRRAQGQQVPDSLGVQSRIKDWMWTFGQNIGTSTTRRTSVCSWASGTHRRLAGAYAPGRVRHLRQSSVDRHWNQHHRKARRHGENRGREASQDQSRLLHARCHIFRKESLAKTQGPPRWDMMTVRKLRKIDFFASFAPSARTLYPGCS